MRILEDIENMSRGDHSFGIVAHYKPIAAIVNENNFKEILEVGCAYGNNAEYLLQNTKLKRLFSVDPYLFYDAMPGFSCQQECDTLYEYAKTKLERYTNFKGIIKENSKMAYAYFLLSNTKFNLIFLDGNHEYETVKWEIEHYYKLIKRGGVLCGHDYNIFDGILKAVNEMASTLKVRVTIHDGNIWAFHPKPNKIIL